MALTPAEKQRRDRERRKAPHLPPPKALRPSFPCATLVRCGGSVRCRSTIGTVSTVSLYDTAWGECLQIIVEADIEEIEPPCGRDTWNPDCHVTMPGDAGRQGSRAHRSRDQWTATRRREHKLHVASLAGQGGTPHRLWTTTENITADTRKNLAKQHGCTDRPFRSCHVNRTGSDVLANRHPRTMTTSVQERQRKLQKNLVTAHPLVPA